MYTSSRATQKYINVENVLLGVVVHTSRCGRYSEESQEVKVILGYTANVRSVWNTPDPVSNSQREKGKGLSFQSN